MLPVGSHPVCAEVSAASVAHVTVVASGARTDHIGSSTQTPGGDCHGGGEGGSGEEGHVSSQTTAHDVSTELPSMPAAVAQSMELAESTLGKFAHVTVMPSGPAADHVASFAHGVVAKAAPRRSTAHTSTGVCCRIRSRIARARSADRAAKT